MNPHNHYRINRPRVAHETIDGESVMIDFDTGHYFSLNPTGSAIWDLVDAGASPDEIVHALTARYDASQDQVRLAVNQLLSELTQKELLTLDGSDLGASSKPFPSSPADADRLPFVTPQLFEYSDMQDLLLLDPIHEVDEAGWPNIKTD